VRCRDPGTLGEMPRVVTVGEMPRVVTVGEMPGCRNPWWETKVEIFGLIPRSRWRDTSIYRSRRLSRSVSETTFIDQGTTILTEYLLVGNHVHYRDDIGGEGYFPR
jgi:hypothetical protein